MVHIPVTFLSIYFICSHVYNFQIVDLVLSTVSSNLRFHESFQQEQGMTFAV